MTGIVHVLTGEKVCHFAVNSSDWGDVIEMTNKNKQKINNGNSNNDCHYHSYYD